MFLSAFIISAIFLVPSSTVFGDDENPFRMKKLNLIWRKAQNKMSERKLSDFRRLLEMQDRAEMKWKEVKANGGDETGEREAILRRKFAYILEEFGLEKHLDLVHDQGDEIKDNTAGTGAYGDARLNELWNSVLKQGKFTSDELDELHTEFSHYKEKVSEYNDLLKIVMDHEGMSENSVLSQGANKEKELEVLRNQLQDAHLDLTKDFTRLKEKATGDVEEKLFRDPRVNELWEKAKKGGFTEEELDSIKEELNHFDHKIMKHEHFKLQAKESHKLLKEGNHHLKDKFDVFDKKAAEHGKWVKKMHATLMDKVTRNEL